MGLIPNDSIIAYRHKDKILCDDCLEVDITEVEIITEKDAYNMDVTPVCDCCKRVLVRL